MDPSSLMLSIVTGAIGAAYFIYGRRQSVIVPTVAGVLLCVLPYLIDSTLAIGIGSALLMASPLVFKF